MGKRLSEYCQTTIPNKSDTDWQTHFVLGTARKRKLSKWSTLTQHNKTLQQCTINKNQEIHRCLSVDLCIVCAHGKRLLQCHQTGIAVIILNNNHSQWELAALHHSTRDCRIQNANYICVMRSLNDFNATLPRVSQCFVQEQRRVCPMNEWYILVFTSQAFLFSQFLTFRYSVLNFGKR